MRFQIVPLVVTLGLSLALAACARNEGASPAGSASESSPRHSHATDADQQPPAHAGQAAAAVAVTAQPTASRAVLAATLGASLPAFTGSREETARFIEYYRTIALTPEQERVKVEALSAIPAPCCAENPLATCCCPCNMAKAAWGLSAWLITEKGFGVDQLQEATRTWLAAANPDGFSGDACHSGGCSRAMRHNGCGGMNESQVL